MLGNLSEKGQSRGMIRNVMIAIVTLALFGWIANVFLGFTTGTETFREDNLVPGSGEIDIGNSYASVNSGTFTFDYVIDSGAGSDNENVSMTFNGETFLENYVLDNASPTGTVENDLTENVVGGVNTYDVTTTTLETNDNIENDYISVEVDTDTLDVIETIDKWGPDIILMIVAAILALVAAYVLNIFNRV